MSVECFGNELTQILDMFVSFDLKVVGDATFTHIERHPEEVLLNQLYLWYWQGDVHVWLKSHRDTIAVGALHRRLVKPVHKVDYYRLVSLEMVLP